jgi:hypothetical protein
MRDVAVAVELEYSEFEDQHGNHWRSAKVGVPLLASRPDTWTGADFVVFKGWPLLSPGRLALDLGGHPSRWAWFLGLNATYLEEDSGGTHLVVGPNMGHGSLWLPRSRRLAVGLFYDIGLGLDLHSGHGYASFGMGLWIVPCGRSRIPFGAAAPEGDDP